MIMARRLACLSSKPRSTGLYKGCLAGQAMEGPGAIFLCHLLQKVLRHRRRVHGGPAPGRGGGGPQSISGECYGGRCHACLAMSLDITRLCVYVASAFSCPTTVI